MNIVYIATDSYCSMLGISMTSVLMNLRAGDRITFYICSTDLSAEHQGQIEDLVRQYGCSVVFIDIKGYEQVFDLSNYTTGFHPIVLARLLLTQYLPETVNRALYLDSDVIVNGSLSELESISLDGYALAAVPELHMPDLQKAGIGMEPSDIYYNCGVLFINLAYWRAMDIATSLTAYYNEMQGRLMYNDQDVLNHCCKGQIRTLPHTYNYAPTLYYFPRYFIKDYQPLYYCDTAEEFRAIRRNPTIIHYLGEERPWLHGNYSPYRKVYERYKASSMWSDAPLIYGKERILFLFHGLNLVTRICPWFRQWFTERIGIYYYNKNSKS